MPQDDLPPGCTQADVDGPQPDDDADEDSSLSLMARNADEPPADTDTDSVLNALRAPRALGRPNPDRWPQRREGMALMLEAAASDLATMASLANDNPQAYRDLLARAADRYRGAIALFEAEEEGGGDDYDAGDGGED